MWKGKRVRGNEAERKRKRWDYINYPLYIFERNLAQTKRNHTNWNAAVNQLFYEI